MVDLDQARIFLSALSSYDDGETFSFQTFGEKGDLSLVRTIHGRFDDVAEQLVALNEKGAGVFVCVNKTDGMGIRGKNVQRIRAFFVDDDNGSVRWDELPVMPSMVVSSKRGDHAYWLMKNGTSKDAFAAVQKALAETLGTDAKVHNLNRVMRVPGFLHHKGDPFLVQAALVDPDNAYHLEDLVQAFGLDIQKFQVQPRKIVESVDVESIPMERRLQRARGQLRAIGPAIRKSGDGHSKTLAACRVANDFAIPDSQFLPELLTWGATCSPPWPPHKLEAFYWSTIQSVDSGRWPWGGKLLDENYLSEPKRSKLAINPATIYRDDDVPWSSEPPRSEAKIDFIDHAIDEEPDLPSLEDVPLDAMRHVGLLEVVSSKKPRLADAPEVIDLTQAREKKAGRTAGVRVGAAVEDCENDLDHSDAARNPRDISWYLESEYLFRRDDSRCVYIYKDNLWGETTRLFIEKIAMQYTSFEAVAMKDIREATDLALSRRHMIRIPWNRLARTEVPLQNGVLDFEKSEMRDHNPNDYVDRLIPIDWDPSAECPIWLRCLEDWLPGMDVEKDALQQFFGYVLMAHAHYKKALILYGKPDTGKSIVCNIAKALVGGDRFTCSITPDEMDDPRRLASIKGKALNLVSDLKKNTVLADGGFKRLVSSGDPIEIDQKFTRAEMYTPTAKHIFATNNLPTVTDMTDAVFTRLLILTFNRQIPKSQQDRTLEDKLQEELPGILNWAIEGAQKLYENGGRWPQVESSEELIAEYKLHQNPLHYFILESGMVEMDEKGAVNTDELRQAMNEFSDTKPYGRRGFVKLVDAMEEIVPTIKRSKRKGRMVVKGLVWAGSKKQLELV